MKAREKRIMKELEKLKNNPVCNSTVTLEEDEELIVILPGPKGSKYENTDYEISFKFPRDYPFKPPQMEFITPIDLPQVQANGRLDIFSLIGNNYTPALSVGQIIERIHFFMSPVETRIDTFIDRENRYAFEKKPISPLIEIHLMMDKNYIAWDQMSLYYTDFILLIPIIIQ